MAKGKLTPQQQQAALDAEFKSLAPIANEWAKILEKKKAGRKFDEERLKQLEEEYKSYNRLSNKVDKIGDSFNDLNDKIKEFNDDLDDTLNDFDDPFVPLVFTAIVGVPAENVIFLPFVDWSVNVLVVVL